MNKLNKKGFTLIEMLVVIAIIAVLVSIIIPVVSNSTDKAAAATNAANLRSLKAEAVTAFLTKQTETNNLTLTYEDGNIKSITAKDNAPVSKAVSAAAAKVAKDQPATFTFRNGDPVPAYAGVEIDDFAKVAAGEDTPAANN